MQFKNNSKQRSSSIQGLRSFKDTLPKNVKKVINKKGHIYSETLNNWKYIVGENLFKVCYPKSFKNSNKFGVSTLNVMVKRGHEVDLEYSKKKIMNKMNIFFGYSVIKKLKFTCFDNEKDFTSKIDIKKDGIWIIDREKDSLLLLASYIELSEVAKKKATQKTYLNHLSFSPNGKKIVWFLINEEPNSREIIFQGMDLCNKSKIFNIESQRLTSHFCWIDNDRIFTSNRDQNLNWKYSIYNLKNGTKEDLNLKSKFDGHPMYNSHSNQVIIDTTPDSNGFQHLLSIKMLDLSSQQLGKWKSPLKFSGPDRCDLHPRWKEDATAVSIDTIYEDKRCQKIIFLDINELLA